MTNELIVGSLALLLVFVTGCGAPETSELAASSNKETSDQAWTIIKLRDDRGHDTMEDEDGGMYHNYFCAVVFQQGEEKVSLLYVNDLPPGLDLKIGAKYLIQGLDSANFLDDWNSYSLGGVSLVPVGE